MLVIKARWENVVPLWKETGGVVTQDMQKAEVLYDIFTDKCSSYTAQIAEG